MRTTFASLAIAIGYLGDRLYDFGQICKTEKWQGVNIIDKPEYTFLELLNVYFQAPIGEEKYLKAMIKPDLPWADEHFEERVSGISYNPPPSHKNWPYAKSENKEFMEGEIFSHTYPERFWPKRAGANDLEDRFGIRYHYGDLEDVIKLLCNEPYTRQAFLPIWFPEDTGAIKGQRVPCTIGYHFIMRNEYLHIIYYIRSCDYLRHFRNDIYMACRLLYYVLEQMNGALGLDIKAGLLSMQIVNLHIFAQEKRLLLNK